MNYDITEIIENDLVYIIWTDSRSGRVIAKFLKSDMTSDEPEPITQPTQLDRIEAAVVKSKEEIIDAYTLQLVEEGVIS